ncbi:MAG: 7TM-DISM domain-containing protein, partial [Pseudomonadota bacterium]
MVRPQAKAFFKKRAKNAHSTALLGFLLCAVLFLGALPALPASAQLTKTARIELNDATQRVFIGPDSYLSADPDGQLDAQSIASRHKSNLRGERLSSSIINLSTENGPVWLTFSVTNSSAREDWVLHFGDFFDGRLGLVRDFQVLNASTNEVLIDADQKDMMLDGAALPVRIPQSQSYLFTVLIDSHSIISTFAPSLMTPSY